MWPLKSEDATGIDFALSLAGWGIGNYLQLRYTFTNRLDHARLWVNYDITTNEPEFHLYGDVTLEITDGAGQPAQRIVDCRVHPAPPSPPLRVLLAPGETISVIRSTTCGVYAPRVPIFFRATYRETSRIVPPPEPASIWFRGTLVSNKLEVIPPP